MKNEIAIDTVNTENKRLIGLDILKILSMFFILIHHFSKHGGFFANATGFSRTIYLILNSMFLPSVNIFVFVSAYLIVKKNNFKLKRLFYLYFQIIFFAIFTYLVSLIITKQGFNLNVIFSCLDPFNNIFWFTNSYMFMYALTPLLLLIVNKLNKKNYGILVICLLILTLLCTYTPVWGILNNGFSNMWFIFLFFFAGYQAKFGLNINKWIWLALYIATIPLTYFYMPSLMVVPVYTSIEGIIATFALFNLFKDINIKNAKLVKFITLISSSTLGIYLLHDGPFMQTTLYYNIINTPNFYLRPTTLLWFLLFMSLTFVVCFLFDLGRKYVCKLFFKVVEKIKNKKQKEIKEDTV